MARGQHALLARRPSPSGSRVRPVTSRRRSASCCSRASSSPSSCATRPRTCWRPRASSRSSRRASPTAPTCGCRPRSRTGSPRAQARRLRLPGRPARDRHLPPAPVSARARPDRPAPGRRALVLALGPLRGRLRRLPAPARAAGGAPPRRDPAGGDDDRRVRRAGRHHPRRGRRGAPGAFGRRLVPRPAAGRDGRRGVFGPPRPPHRLEAPARGRRAHAGAGAAADRRLARGRIGQRPGLPGLPPRAEPRLARPPLRRGGRPPDPPGRRRDRAVREVRVQRHRAAVPDL